MKKLLFGLIATVLFSNFSFGQRFNSTDFKTIGVEHNRMLEVTYVTILKNKVTNDKKDIVVSALIEDFRKNNYSGKDLELGINTLTHVFDNLPKKGIKMNFQENLYSDELGKSLGVRSLLCGAVAGAAAKTLVYPLDLGKKRMQVHGFHHQHVYKG